ncbi:MAG TPA: cytochrome C oxidase subunit IV family protein [Pyrinomonadaceae bacterium]|jgi:cytochrome c oxidase subunit 4|nr:cytochrome C oxidase subunit IV family protein [Pyrinomonadaceae bacterium]
MSEHIVSRKIYFLIFGALMALTALTVLAAQVSYGNEAVGTVIALTIAVTKAVLVVLYFMHVRYSSRLTWVVIASGFLWLAIMIGLTMSDYLTRGWSALPGGR